MTEARKGAIAITGADGFIGSALVKHFSTRGWSVVALVREDIPRAEKNVTYKLFDLLHSNAIDFSTIDVLVHAAYQPILKKTDTPNPNLVGTKMLAECAMKAGVRVVFFSTLSAHEDAESIYGKTKLKMEKMFDPSRDLVLRPGLVLGGGGGLFGSIAHIVKKSKIIPLIGGAKPIQTIALRDVCRIVEIGVTKNISGIYNMAHPHVLTIKTLYSEIARASGHKPFFLPVPIWLVFTILSLTEILRIKLPFTTENVLGLKCLRAFDTKTSLKKFDASLLDYKEALRVQAE